MAHLNEHQRNMADSSYNKTSYTYRNGNINVHYQKDANGRMIPVARPAFIKIK